jgi:nitrate/nitrite-specific signal transduction histidine kinase
VSIERSGSSLSLSVEDDGRGFEPAAGGGQAASGGDGHYGLRFMRERAAELGAALEIDSAPGRGTRVTVRLPVAAAETGDGAAGGAPPASDAPGRRAVGERAGAR